MNHGTDAELHESWRVLQALGQLCTENQAWERNHSTFARMDTRNRIWWWRAAKKQAERGAPAMQTLLLRVIEIRLKE